jgi:hypothetical protein
MQGTFAVFAVLPQIIKHRCPCIPQKSWDTDDPTSKTTAKILADLSLFSAVFEVQSHRDGAATGNTLNAGRL